MGTAKWMTGQFRYLGTDTLRTDPCLLCMYCVSLYTAKDVLTGWERKGGYPQLGEFLTRSSIHHLHSATILEI